MYIGLNKIDFELDKKFIAQNPCKPRDYSKLLIIDSFLDNRANIQNDIFYNITKYLDKDDIIILNNTKVFKARIYGYTEDNHKIEILLLKCIDKNINLWEVICNKKDKFIKYKKIFINKNLYTYLHTYSNASIIKIQFSNKYNELINYINNYGNTPLPPYIKNNNIPLDKYQTVFAKKVGSCASPTASLHFTNRVLKKIDAISIKRLFITLHVGLGTFKPINTENVYEHTMHAEEVYINTKTLLNILELKQKNKKILCVGTTSIRAIESAIHWWCKKLNIKQLDNMNILQKKIYDFCTKYNYNINDEISFETDLFITPGYKFVIADKLITNFHTPKSTLILLVSAFLEYKYNIKDGIEAIKDVYEYAKENNYRFFSFGDVMFIK